MHADRLANPLTTNALTAKLHVSIERVAKRLHVLHESRTQCRKGCSSCCVDDISVFEVEADELRAHYPNLLASGVAHSTGACAFLDSDNSCRVYAHRPYVCRTQGLPLRWLENRADEVVELRDICPLNEEGPRIEELDAEACWSIGPVEEELAAIQLAARQTLTRVALRSLFAR